ncbi:MAG: SMC family ATPase [Candidatus Poseidoniia archaeon]|nr:SMC family ATPase [Candidatus Poseidoniia archaeon]
MRLRSLAIRNYRSIRRLQVEFPDGVLGIVGHNGAGKSSLLEAVAWALYGTPAVRTRAEAVATIGASDPCRVRLEFDLGGEAFRLERVLKPSSTTAELARGDELLAEGAREVADYVAERLLRMDYQTFYASIFTRQGELDKFVSMSSEPRRQAVERLLRISDVREAGQRARQQKRDLGNRLEGLRSQLVARNGEPLQPRLAAELAALQERSAALGKAGEPLETALGTATQQDAQAVKAWEQAEANAEQYRAAEKRRDAAQSALKLAGERLQNAQKSLDNSYKKEKEAVELRTATAASDAPGKLAALREKQAAVEKELQELAAGKGKLDAALAANGRELVNGQKHLREIHELGAESECPTCERPLGEHGAALMERIAGEIGALEQQQRETRAALEALAQTREATASRRAALGKQEEKLRGAEAAHTAQLAQLKALERELARKPDLEQQLAELQTGEQAARAEQEAAQAALAKLEFDPQAHANARQQREAVAAALSEAKLALERHRGELKAHAGKLEAKQAELERVERAQAQIGDAEAELERFGLLEQLLKGFRSHITSRIAPTLAAHTSRRLAQLTDGRYTQVEIDGSDYSLKVFDGVEAHSLDRFSGGEADAFSLALRLSISQLLSERAGTEMGLVVLDEVLGSQDELRQRRVLEGLERMARSVGQVILVTHIESVKDHLPHVWELVLDEERGTVLREL